MALFEENFEVPKKPSDYLNLSKMQDEDVKIRILSHPIRGWSEYVQEGDKKKAYRYRFEKKPSKPLTSEGVGLFFAFIIWNYKEERIQCLEISQATIQKPLLQFAKDPDLGDVWLYDLKISKKTKPKSVYSIFPLKEKAVDESIKQAFTNKPGLLDVLYVGGEVFSPQNNRRTKGFWEVSKDEIQEPFSEPVITEEQASKLENLIGDDETYKENVMAYLQSTYRVFRLQELPAKLWDKVYKSIKEHSEIRLKKEMLGGGMDA